MGTSTTSDNAEYVELSVVGIANRVLRGRKILLATTLTGLIISAGCAMLLKPWYYAQAVFLPPKYSDLATTTPAASLLSGASDSSDAYLGLLNSRTVQDDVVEHTDLMQAYRAPTKTAARLMLAKNSMFGVGRNSLIYITIESDTPKRAADIANAYLDALYRLNGNMVQSSSARRRLFFQDQLNEQKQILLNAEEQLKRTQMPARQHASVGRGLESCCRSFLHAPRCARRDITHPNQRWPVAQRYGPDSVKPRRLAHSGSLIPVRPPLDGYLKFR